MMIDQQTTVSRRFVAPYLICGTGAISLLLGIYATTAISKALAAVLGLTSLLGATYW